jgi:two-component system, cell cycle sensor histidine kinase and response regulator CckA
MSTDPPEQMSQAEASEVPAVDEPTANRAGEAVGVPAEAYRALFQRNLDGLLLVAPDGQIVESNAAAREMLGLTEAELRASRLENLFIAGPAYSERAAERERTGRTAGETTFMRKDGTRFAADFTSIMPGGIDEPGYGLVSFRDITERKAAEAYLSESETRVREVLEHGGVGVAYWDLDGRLLFLNRKATENLGGASPDDFVGKPFQELFGEEAGGAYLARIHAAAASPTPMVYEDRVDLPVGRRWLSSVHTRSLDSAGNVVGVHVYANDITALKEAEEALRVKEGDLLQAQRLAHIGNYTLDLRTQQLTWSEGMFHIWGLDPQQGAPRDSIRSFVRSEVYERLSHAAIEAIERGTPYELDFRIRRPDGAERTIVTTSEPQCDASGQVVTLKGTHQDITERRQAEDEYHTLFREMLDGFALHEIICDAAGTPIDYRFMAVNPAFERVTGLRAADIVGRTVLEVLPGTERYWIETYGDVALTGRPAFFENYHSQLDMHFHVTAFQPAPGQFACIFSDITERKRAEDALRESEAKIRGILDNIRVGVALISPRMEILELNPLMREWFPHVDTDQTPICYRAFNQPPRETVCEYCPTIETLRDGRMHEATTETPVAGGVRNYRVVSSPIFGASGEVSAAIEMVEDVTEKLALEHQLQQSQKMESIGRLAGGVAHDFNNMLGVILGHMEMALDQTDVGEPLHASLREVQKAAERSAELTHQLLAFARKQTVAPKVVDVNETVAGMLKMLERLIGEDIRLDWQPVEDLWHVRIDPSQVGQILTNLCVNARDAIAGVGRVAIATCNRTVDLSYCLAHASLTPGDYVQLTVSDDGCGMDQETMARLFEPFFTTKGLGKGTGLGLATVYGIARQNGGIVEAESELGRGSTFTILLPRHGEAAEAVQQPAETAPPTRGRETILLVEDEPALLDLATLMLRSQGYTVVASGNPGEAIRVAREHRGEIHLLITDVVMPEMNGRDLAKNLLSLYPNIKLLFMSGHTSDVIAHQGVLEEGVNFLQKPFSSKDLGNAVRAVLDSEQ